MKIKKSQIIIVLVVIGVAAVIVLKMSRKSSERETVMVIHV